MSIQEQINAYISSLPEAKAEDISVLHKTILSIMPNVRLWYSDGKTNEGKTVSNPNIGYGKQIIEYSECTTKKFNQIGISTK